MIDSDVDVDVLVVIGSVGVGKSSTADAASEILRKRDVPHAIIDMDYLRYAFPWPASDPFHQALGTKNLAGIWKNYQEIDVRKLIISNVVESRADIDAIAKAIPGAKLTVVLLKADVATVHERLRERHGKRDSENLNWHLDRARKLTGQLEDAGIEDFAVDTKGKSLAAVAETILAKWPNN